MRRFIVSLALALLWLLTPRAADAQWYAGLYLGASHTHSADVTIDQSTPGRSFTFQAVDFDGRPFEPPQYYGWRLGRFVGARRRLGIELEFLHLKAIGRTDRSYAVSGLPSGGGPVLMNTVVQRYSMTHGLNFALINVVLRTPVGSRFALAWRAGLGPTLPHAETTIDGVSREQYEYAGVGGHASAGFDVRMWRRVSAVAEYKFTIARPRIDVAGGTGVMKAATQQVAFGLAFGLPR